MYFDKISSDETGTSIDVQENFNSEWNKLCLLVWKNIRLLWADWQYFFISVLSSVIFCIFLIALRLTTETSRHPVQVYPLLDLADYWSQLLNLVSERKSKVDKRLAGFTYNSFVPQKMVGYAPYSQGYENIMQGAGFYLKDQLTYKSYNSCVELKLAVLDENLLAGVCFEHLFAEEQYNGGEAIHFIGGIYPNHLRLRLMFPIYTRIYHDTFIGYDWQTRFVFHFVNKSSTRYIDEPDGGPVGYIREGFAPLQNAIALSYLKLIAAIVNKDFQIPDVYMCRFPNKEFQENDPIEAVQFSISMMIVFGNFYPVLMCIGSIVSEKDGKLRVFSKIMGISNYVHFLGWMSDFLIRALISSFLVVALLKIGWSGEAILPRSNFIALLMVISVYNITSICFVLMVASFYDRILNAVSGGAVLWFFTYLPYIDSLSNDLGPDWMTALVAVFFHNSAFGYAMQNILEFEIIEEGFKLENFFDVGPLERKISTGSFVCIMLLQCVLYASICLYVEELKPGNYGSGKSWDFMFTFSQPLQRKPVTRALSLESVSSDSQYAVSRPSPFIHEVDAEENELVVDIKNVSKAFDDVFVLQNLSLQLHTNEITVLVGHNGSGKSTLIAMMSGLRSITTGNITIDGFDVRDDERYACANIGLCMGDTLLYPDLTVEDQLRFFCRLKGFRDSVVENELERYLERVKLTNYSRTITKSLPLGVRQVLAICCALIGRSRVVLLDDPSAHTDLPSRNLIWQLLEEEKVNRAILISSPTASIVDSIGDRVAIISHGDLKCDGTPVFIKKMYGQGFRLIISKGPHCKVAAVTQHIGQFVPNIVPLCSLGNEITYALEDPSSDVYKDLTDSLENNMYILGIESVTLRHISLDDIFFKLAAANASYENRTRLMELMNGESIYTEDNKNLRFMQIKQRVKGISKRFQQFKAMWFQRWLYAKYRKAHYSRRLIYPILFVIAGFVAADFSFIPVGAPRFPFHFYDYESTSTIIERRYAGTANSEVRDNVTEHYKELIFWEGVEHTLKEITNLMPDYYLQMIHNGKQRVDRDHHVGVTFGDGYILAWFNNYAMHTVPLSLNLVHNALYRTIYSEAGIMAVINDPIQITNDYQYDEGMLRVVVNSGNVLAICIGVCYCCLWNTIAFLFTQGARVDYDHIQILAGGKIWIHWLVNFCFDTMMILIASVISTLTIRACQYYVGIDNHIYFWYFLVLVLAGIVIISVNYALSFVFRDAVHSYCVSLSLDIFGIICFSHIMEAFDRGYTADASSSKTVYFIFLPLFTFCSAMSTIFYNGEFLRICRNEQIRLTSIYVENCQATPNCCQSFELFAFKNGILMELLAMLCYILICWIIILVCDYSYLFHFTATPRDNEYAQLEDHKRRHNNEADSSLYGVESAVVEKSKIENMTCTQLHKHPLICDRVGKIDGNVMTVARISLSIDRFESFGLLGTSGCGITTFLNIIGGGERPSYGRVLVHGRNVAYNLNLLRNSIGYAKQEMLHIPELCIKDIMEYMCSLRSYPSKYIEEICLNLAKVFGVIQFYNKSLGAISAGTLNRVNCAIAVMGNPKIMLLDEALSGIDSAGKRKVMNILKRMQDKGACVLLGTSSLTDCDRYCSRIGFMAYGRLCVIRTTRLLDKLYSQTHFLKVKLGKSMKFGLDTNSNLYMAFMNKLTDFVQGQFAESVLKEQFGTTFIFLIPAQHNSISYIFETLKQNANKLNIEDFELTHCSLSQAFIDFWEREHRVSYSEEKIPLWTDSF